MIRPLALALSVLAVGASLAGAQAARPTPRPTPTPAPKRKEPPRVFTNDDLEAARKRPSNVQDLSATPGTPGVLKPKLSGMIRMPIALFRAVQSFR